MKTVRSIFVFRRFTPRRSFQHPVDYLLNLLTNISQFCFCITTCVALTDRYVKVSFKDLLLEIKIHMRFFSRKKNLGIRCIHPLFYSYILLFHSHSNFQNFIFVSSISLPLSLYPCLSRQPFLSFAFFSSFTHFLVLVEFSLFPANNKHTNVNMLW